MSTNWKQIGKTNRNSNSNEITFSKIISNVGNKIQKGVIFDISGDNLSFGIGTSNPFSRLSFGEITNNGVVNTEKPGQLSAIALNETSTGNNFKGIIYNTDVKSFNRGGSKTNALQLLNINGDFSVDNSNNGMFYVTEENVTVIGGNPTEGNEVNINKGIIDAKGIKIDEDNGSGGNTKIVLDVKGSLRTNGYINFYNKIEGTDTSSDSFEPELNFWNDSNTRRYENIPHGSLWLRPAGNGYPSGLYFKNESGNAILISGQSGESQLTTASNFFDGSLEAEPKFIIQRSSITGQVGGTPIVFSGNSETKTTDINAYKNLVTITSGNLSVCSSDGSNNAIVMDVSNPIYELTDPSGGIIWSQKQLLIGNKKSRRGWGTIDINIKQHSPVLLSYPLDPNNETEYYKPEKATNSLLLLTKMLDEQTHKIGTIYDVSASIIIGGRFRQIDTPSSIISNELTSSTGNKIVEKIGNNIMFGRNNDLSGVPFSFVLGADNEIKNINTAVSAVHGGGSLVIGKSNSLKYDKPEFNSHFILGDLNNSFSSKNSFIQGTNNNNYGEYNFIFGNNNTLAIDNETLKENNNDYSVNYSFCVGEDNKIRAPFSKNIHNAILIGKNIQLDLSHNTFMNDIDKSYVLLGSKASIKQNTNPDIRFAFGTKEKDGNVFTIDMSGNTRIYGNLVVDGSRVILNTEVLDVSDNNISLNIGGNEESAIGGGITLVGPSAAIKWNNDGKPSNNYWDTSGADISTNNIYVNELNVKGGIVIDNLSLQDISANHFYTRDGNVDINGTMSILTDISANDASFNRIDISGITNLGVFYSQPQGEDGAIMYNKTTKQFEGFSGGYWGGLGGVISKTQKTKILTDSGEPSTSGGNPDASGILFFTYKSEDSSGVRMVIEPSGRVGIGIDNPTEILDVSGNISLSNHSDGNAPNIYFDCKSHPTTITNGLVWRTRDPNYQTDNGKESAKITFGAEAGNYTGGLRFYTNSRTDSTTDCVERMRIDMSGNVGIGINNPDEALVVKSDGDTYIKILNTDGTAKQEIGIQFVNQGVHDPIPASEYYGGDAYIDWRIVTGKSFNGGHTESLYFTRKSSTGHTSDKVLVLSQAGNVGIGISKPNLKLEVDGDISANATIYANDISANDISANDISANHFYTRDGNVDINGTKSIFTDISANDATFNTISIGMDDTSTVDSTTKLHIQRGHLYLYGNSPHNTNTDNWQDQSKGAEKAQLFFGCNNDLGSEVYRKPNGIIWKTKHNDNNGPYSKKSAQIVFQPEGNFYRGGIGFYTNNFEDRTTDAKERMRIDMNGNVGIGVKDPSSNLHVQNSTADGNTKIICTGGFGGSGDAEYYAGQSLGYGGSLRYDAGNDVIQINRRDAGQDYTVISIPYYKSNVGIGISVPNFKLEVDGDISANAVYANDISANDISANHFYTRDGNVDINGTKSIFTDISGNDAIFNTISTIGKVGIGTHEPYSLLDIERLESAKTEAAAVRIYVGDDNSNHYRFKNTALAIVQREYEDGPPAEYSHAFALVAGYGAHPTIGLYTKSNKGEIWLRNGGTTETDDYKHNNADFGELDHKVKIRADGDTYFNGGNVGIGNGATNPQSLLHLYKNTDDIVIDDISYSNVLRLTSQYSSSSSHKRGPLITFTNKIDDDTGNLNSVTGDPDHSEYYMAAIGSHQRDASNTDDYQGSLSFYTKDRDNDGGDSTTLQERMTITNDGKVGIGTTTPLQKLHVNGSILFGDGVEDKGFLQSGSWAIGLSAQEGIISYDNGLGKGKNGFTGMRIVSHINDGVERDDTKDGYSQNIEFYTHHYFGGNAAYKTRMAIAYNGNIGIGVVEPNFKLEVDGDISANAVYAKDLSANDISANHFSTRDGNVDINGTKSILTNISANDASFNTVHLNGNVFATHGDVSIGTADMPIKDLYLSSDSLYIGVNPDGSKGHKITITESGQMKFQKFKRKQVNGQIKEVEDTEEPGINSFNDISANDISANDISANDVYVNSIRMKDTGHKLSIYDLSGVESGSGLTGQILTLNAEGNFEFQTPANGSVITSDTTLTIKDLSGSDIRGIHFYTLDGNVDINGTKSVFTDINLNGDISLKNKIKFENEYGIIEAEDNHHAIYMRNSYENISKQNPGDNVDTMDFYEFGDIRFFTNGEIHEQTERMRIKKNGEVIIGEFKISGNDITPETATTMVLNDKTSIDTLINPNGGKVGIGTDSPAENAVLHVHGIIALSGTRATPPDYACIYHQDNVGPIISGLNVKIYTGTDTPTAALTINDNGNVSIERGNFIGNLLGNATSVTNGVYTTSSVTALNDVTHAGSGRIITDDERTKLNGIDTSADVTDFNKVRDAGALMDSEVTDLAGIKSVTISSLQVKPSEGAFQNGDKSKLDTIGLYANITSTANVRNAGAIMSGELYFINNNLAINQNSGSSYPLYVNEGYNNTSNTYYGLSIKSDYVQIALKSKNGWFLRAEDGGGSSGKLGKFDRQTIGDHESHWLDTIKDWEWALFTNTKSQKSIGIYATKSIYAGGQFVISSDRRIKENIVEVPHEYALEKMRRIRPYIYDYKDALFKTNTIGFIAQEVFIEIPDAITFITKIIPNEIRNPKNIIWEEVDISGSTKFKLTIPDLEDVSGNTKYKFYMSNDLSNNDECEKISFTLEDDPKSFIFDQSWNYVFLYGKEVDDFYSLDKQKLFQINYAATLEIDRIQQEEKTKLEEAELKIATLEAENATLKSQIADILSRLQTLENA